MKYIKKFESSQLSKTLSDDEADEVISMLQDMSDEFSMDHAKSELDFKDNSISLLTTNGHIGLHIVVSKKFYGTEEEDTEELEKSMEDEASRIRKYWFDYVAPRIESLGYKINAIYQNYNRYIDALVYKTGSRSSGLKVHSKVHENINHNELLDSALDIFKDVVDEFGMETVKPHMSQISDQRFHPNNAISFSVLLKEEDKIVFKIVFKGDKATRYNYESVKNYIHSLEIRYAHMGMCVDFRTPNYGPVYITLEVTVEII